MQLFRIAIAYSFKRILLKISLVSVLISLSLPVATLASDASFSITRASYQSCAPVNNPKDCRKVPMAKYTQASSMF